MRRIVATTRTLVRKERSIAVHKVSPEVKKQTRHEECNPSRNNLTKREWAEWGDGLRRLKGIGYTNPQSLSLSEMRDVLWSMEQCCFCRVKHQIGMN